MDQPIFDIIMQDEYDSWGASLPSHNWCCNTLVEVAFIVKALDLKKNQCVLDLFCSWGRHVVELVDKGYNVKGLDRSEELIDKATEIAKSKNIKIDFIIANILTWNEKDKYDVIYSLHSSVFEAWRTEAEIIKYLNRCHRKISAVDEYPFTPRIICFIRLNRVITRVDPDGYVMLSCSAVRCTCEP